MSQTEKWVVDKALATWIEVGDLVVCDSWTCKRERGGVSHLDANREHFSLFQRVFVYP